MAIRESTSGSFKGLGPSGAGGTARLAELWQRHNNRTGPERAADRETAVSRTLAGSSNPTLLFEHLDDGAKGVRR